MTGDPKNAVAQNAALAARVSYADYAHSMAHQQVAESIEALQTAVDAGVTGDAGKTINDLQAAFQAIDTEFASVKSDVAALNLVPGPKGDKGVKGNPGTSIGVTVGPSAPGSAKDGDFWIDGTEGFIYASGAWLKLNGAPGAQGPRGSDGNSVKTVTASSEAWNQLPWVNWDRVTGALELGIPSGAPGAPFTFRGLIYNKNLLPDPTAKLGEAYSVNDGGAFTEMYVSDGTQWVLAAKLGNGADGGIGPQGPDGLDAFETWKKRSFKPTAGLQDWIDALRGLTGPRGEPGKPGETLKVQGIVATFDQLPASPPPLTVLAVQETLTMYVFDPNSPAAGANGWVDMGKVQGPPGEPAWLNTQVADDLNLPAGGAPGEMRISLGSGHIWGWSETSATWVDGGVIGRSHLSALEDVNAPTPGSDEVLAFDATSSRWKPSGLFASKRYVDFQIETMAIGLSHEVPVLSILSEPPADLSSVVDQYFIVSSTPTEGTAFEGHADEVAFYVISTGSGSYEWHFSTPRDRETHLVESEGANYTWNGTAWVKVAQPAPQDTTGGLYTVGSVQQSLLTETQFRTELGPLADKWVLADGRNVALSKYAQITGRDNVPDLRGAYFRMAGNNTNHSWQGGSLLEYQEDTTRHPRKQFTTNHNGNHKHDPGPGRLRTYGGGGNGSVNHTYGDGYNQSISDWTDYAGSHAHTVTGGGDAETRPKTFAVNYFIKVN